MHKTAFALLSILLYCTTQANADSVKLSGTVIGTSEFVDYDNNNAKTTKVNTRECALDGDLDTFLATYDRSNTWVGYDLGSPHVITQVGWAPRNDNVGPNRVILGVFEGANREDFMDAVPLYVIPRAGTRNKLSHADVNVSRGFRYVRYMGPHDARCNVAEVEFYGYESEGCDEQFYQPTVLPVVNIHVENAAEPVDKVNDLVANICIISEDGANFFEQPGSTRLRGNASMQFEKKPYRIKFDKKQNVLDAPAKAKKWTLINNYGDKTLMRNLIAFELSKRVGLEYTPYGQAVDVIFNGEYKGTYQLCDQVEVNDNRVNVEPMDENCTEGDALTGGYLIEIDAYAYDEDNYFVSKKGNPVTIKYPDSEDILDVQTNYIKDHFNKMEAALFANNFTSEDNGYRKYLDLTSFLQHFIVGELSGNTDTYWSVYMYKHRNDDKLYVGPCWDFDIAFDNDYRTYHVNDKTDYVYRSGGSFAGKMKSFVDRILINDAKARAQLKDMWAELRSSGLIDAESLTDFVRALEQELKDSQKLNFFRWNILNSYVHMNPAVYGSYAGEVNNVVKYLEDRIVWLDNKIGYDASGIERIGNFLDDNNKGIYTLSGTKINAGRDVDAINDLNTGIYILKENGKSKIIQIR